jgi:AcrR family transcriptional regulator
MSAERLESHVRREQIAQAALTVIAAGGLRGLSMGAVARRVGLVPSALYRHFRSKDELLEATLDLIHRRLQANLRAARAAGRDPLETLRQALLRHVSTIRENQVVPQLLFSEDFYARRPERKARVLEIVRAYLGGVAEIVREGQQQGGIRSDLEPTALAVMFLGLVQPGAVLWYLSDGGFDVTRHATRGWEVFSEVIAGPAASPGHRRGSARRSRLDAARRRKPAHRVRKKGDSR